MIDEEMAHREKKLRRKILERIGTARPTPVGCVWLSKILGEDPQDVYRLAADLELAELIQVHDTRRLAAQEKGPNFATLTITAAGVSLLAGQTDKHPLVEDERI
jgi:hypothetical protein